MKLHYSPGACSLASHIALHESGLPFELDKLNVPTKTTASGENFMRINPKGYVPTIQLDDGTVLTEGAVILQYIADQNPVSGLAPKQGSMERYRLQEWLNYIAAEIHKSYSPLFNKAASEDIKTNARNMLNKRLPIVEMRLAEQPYLMGASFTVADAYLFVVLSWSAMVGFDLSTYPKIKDYLANIATRPAVLAAMKAEGLIS
ncbi:MAG: glutathione transferase GstA [Gallionella sp.]|nr:glutathione transferase GstA [Gallionella sp.]